VDNKDTLIDTSTCDVFAYIMLLLNEMMTQLTLAVNVVDIGFDSIPGRIKPKTIKLVFAASPLSVKSENKD
jgi:hypothetical protein